MTIILDNGKHFNLIRWTDDPTTSSIHVYFDPIIGCNDTIRLRGYLVFSPYMYPEPDINLHYSPSLSLRKYVAKFYQFIEGILKLLGNCAGKNSH